MTIRALEAGDEALVAELWRRQFRPNRTVPLAPLEHWVQQVYLAHPNRSDDVPSWVAVTDAGMAEAFAGVTVAQLTGENGFSGRLATVFPPVVDPQAGRSAAAGLLLRRVLSGPQDVTWSDGGHPKFERVWRRLGGEVEGLGSLRWVKLFRPNRHAATSLDVPVAASLLVGAAGLADAGLRSLLTARFTAAGRSPTRGDGSRPFVPTASRAIPAQRLTELLATLHGAHPYRVAYREADLAWRLSSLRGVASLAPIVTAEVADEDGHAVGAYVASLPRGRVGRVFLLAHASGWDQAVVDRLLKDADDREVTALMGRLDPSVRRAVIDRGALVHPGGSLRLVHARDPELQQAALLGRLHLPRLEGESWIWWRIDEVLSA